MKPLHKYLTIILCVTVVVLVTLKVGAISAFSSNHDNNSSSNERSHQLDGESSERQKFKSRERHPPLSPQEVQDFLHNTIIAKVDFQDISLTEALKELNRLIAQQSPDHPSRPEIRSHLVSSFPVTSKSPASFVEDHAVPVEYSSIPTIQELRLRKIPAEVLVKYICDASRCRYWIYRGNVYVSNSWDRITGEKFYNEEPLGRINLNGKDASQITPTVNAIVQNHEFFGNKPTIKIRMSKKAKEALIRGQIALPTYDQDLDNATLGHTVMTILMHSGGTMSYIDDGEIIYDPLNEMADQDPFAYPSPSSATFNIPLDENWSKPANEPASPSK